MQMLFEISPKLLKFQHIIIYGTGNGARETFKALLQYNVRVDCFCHVNPSVTGTTFMGKEVRHVNDLVNEKKTAAVIVTGLYIDTIYPALKEEGFENIFLNPLIEGDIILLDDDILE